MIQDKQLICVNQVSGPLFIDIINTFTQQNINTLLFTGNVESTYTELLREVTIKKSKSYVKKNIFLKLLTWSMFCIHLFFFLLCIPNKSKKKLLLVSNPPFNPWIGLFYKKCFNLSYSVLIYDVYPDILEHHGYLKSNSVLLKIWKNINTYTFSHADEIVTISEGMKQAITPYAKSKIIHIVNCWVDSHYLKPLQKKENPFAKKHNQVDKLTILYSGNFGASHPLESVLEVASHLKSYSDIHFLFIGDGAKKQLLLKTVQDKTLKNVTILPFQDGQTLPFSLTSGDISIVAVDKQSSQFIAPSKLYYMMAAGTCILCISEPNSEISRLQKLYDFGTTISETNIMDMVSFILEMKKNKSNLKTFKHHSRKAAADFTPKNASKFVEIIKLNTFI